ncbi:MAG: UDP-N-acetylglucosamine 2-epimerase (non-hydrolyzing) [Armatimonadetes bacterium]|nr:UDP-N-acetylglucosamine 2-epimerase (non-hydrolyzing) [Armatimonadota bacterium]MDE2207330.1 UDP-N-acetylglucosamine 2-epimerase (non-hydrolyzing) [Armatimonadota bacterium]
MPEAALPRRVLCVFGTRPDAVKMAPVVRALMARPAEFTTRVLVTGQHREQLDQVLRVFGISPDADLAVMQPGQSLAAITTRVLEGVDVDLTRYPQDICLAQGDTTTTFSAALAAFYHKVPFGHVEAGLRTGEFYDPFPEELNRRLAGALATWHFAPTELAVKNLLAEGVRQEAIFLTGNTSIDALHMVPDGEADLQLQTWSAQGRRLVLVTAHRRENWGEPMARIARAIARLAASRDDCEIVVAMHLNPVVRGTLTSILTGLPHVHLIEPPDYAPFVQLMRHASLILTDSGGVQEEAPSFGVPILVLRKTTERAEGVSAGTARLVGTDTEEIVRWASLLLDNPEEWSAMAHASNPYGDGTAAQQIVEILACTDTGRCAE